jgi:ketosteroid isomerase-like protein
MKTVYTAILVSLLLLVSGCAKVNDPADVQAIKASAEEFTKAFNAMDANAAVAMMTDHTSYADANVPVAVGKETIKKLMQDGFGIFAQFNVQFSMPVTDVQVSGDLGAARGTWTVSLTHKPGILAPIKDSGSWSTVCRRQSDGSWKWDSMIANSDQPAPGRTADFADEKELLQIEQDTATAIAKGDTAIFDKILAKEWVYYNDGQVQSRAQALAELKTAYKLTAVTIRDLNTHIVGNLAVVPMTVEMKGTYKGKEIPGPLQGVDFFVKRDGRWQIVYSQNISLKP